MTHQNILTQNYMAHLNKNNPTHSDLRHATIKRVNFSILNRTPDSIRLLLFLIDEISIALRLFV